MHRTRKLLAIVSIAAATLAGQQPTPPAPQAAPQAAQPQTQAQPPVQMGALNLQNASLTEVIDQLARMLHINYIIDPSVKGGVTLNTYGDLRNVDPRNLLEQILRINGFGMTEVGGVYRIVSLKDMAHQPIRPQVNAQNIPEDDQTMLNIVFLKYVSVEELVKVLQEFIGENARLVEYPPANILFILDSRRNMRRTMELIDMFDSDTFANQRVHIFEVKNARPSDLVKELDNIFKSISLDTKTGTVKFLPVDRINEADRRRPQRGRFRDHRGVVEKTRRAGEDHRRGRRELCLSASNTGSRNVSRRPSASSSELPAPVTVAPVSPTVATARRPTAAVMAAAMAATEADGGGGGYGGGYGGNAGYGDRVRESRRLRKRQQFHQRLRWKRRLRSVRRRWSFRDAASDLWLSRIRRVCGANRRREPDRRDRPAFGRCGAGWTRPRQRPAPIPPNPRASFPILSTTRS